MTWPHLLSIEFLAAAMMSIFLLLMGLFINAPLEDLANGNVTPAVAKAPWYFLGLQELLAYFHPVVSGVLVPAFVLRRRRAAPVHRSGQRPRHATVGAQDGRRPVQPVLHPRPRRHLRRDLLPGPRLQLRDPVRDHGRPPLQSLTRVPERTSHRDEQLPRRAGRRAQGAHEGGHQGPPSRAGPGHVAAAAPAHVAGRRRRALARRGHRRAASASCGRTSRAASAARSRSASSATSSWPTPSCRSTRASRPTCRTRGPTSS